MRIFKSSLQSARLNFINIAQLDTKILNFKKATQMKKIYIALFVALAFSLCIQSISGFKGIKISMSNDAQDIRLKSSPKLSEDQNTQMQNLADFLRFSDIGQRDYYGKNFFSDIATTWNLYEKLADIDELDFGRNANFMTVSPIRVDEVAQVPPEICLLSNLKKLDLQGTRVSDLPSCVQNLKKLKYLGLRATKFTEISENISKIPNLKTLILDRCSVKELSANVANLKNLEYLELDETHISQLPPQITGMSKLRELHCYSCKFLHTLPTYLAELKSLEILYLTNTHIEALPDEVSRMPSLKELSEDFTSPPENIVNLPNLEEWGHMDEQRLRLAVKIPSLKRLHIGSNIKTIPSELGDLHNLQELDIWSENIQEIPESIGALKSLKKLDIGRYKQESLPESIGMLDALEELKINSQAITKIPESIGNLHNLKELYIHGKNITQLPESIGNLKNLEILDISETAIKKLPQSINDMTSLKYIDLRDTDLEELNVDFIRLSKLYGINLYGVKLKKKPVVPKIEGRHIGIRGYED